MLFPFYVNETNQVIVDSPDITKPKVTLNVKYLLIYYYGKPQKNCIQFNNPLLTMTCINMQAVHFFF